MATKQDIGIISTPDGLSLSAFVNGVVETRSADAQGLQELLDLIGSSDFNDTVLAIESLKKLLLYKQQELIDCNRDSLKETEDLLKAISDCLSIIKTNIANLTNQDRKSEFDNYRVFGSSKSINTLAGGGNAVNETASTIGTGINVVFQGNKIPTSLNFNLLDGEACLEYTYFRQGSSITTVVPLSKDSTIGFNEDCLGDLRSIWCNLTSIVIIPKSDDLDLYYRITY